MALANVLGAAAGLAKQRLSGRVGSFVDLAERLARRVANSAANPSFGPVNPPGPRDWLAAANARPDPLLDIYWYCDLPIINADTVLPWSYVEEVTLPNVEFDQTSVYKAGKNYHFPNHYNLNTLSIKLYEDVDGKAMNYLYAWQSMIIDRETGLYNHPREYKHPITIVTLDSAQLTVMIYEYTGCWPQNIDNVTVISGNTGRVNPNVTFSVDEVRIKFGKFSPGQIPSVVNNIGRGFPASLSKLPSAFPDVFSTATALLAR